MREMSGKKRPHIIVICWRARETDVMGSGLGISNWSVRLGIRCRVVRVDEFCDGFCLIERCR